MDIGFIGLGNMGLAMARNLSVPVTACAPGTARRSRPAPARRDAGRNPGRSLRRRGRGSRCSPTMPRSAPCCSIPAVFAGAAPGTVHVVSATIRRRSPRNSKPCSAAASAICPLLVFGCPGCRGDRAAQHPLAAGDPATLAKVRPAVRRDRPAHLRARRSPGAGQHRLSAGNMMIAMAIESMAESRGADRSPRHRPRDLPRPAAADAVRLRVLRDLRPQDRHRRLLAGFKMSPRSQDLQASPPKPRAMSMRRW